MSTFKLSLPTDIPWRRISVSKDMLDLVTCDDERPPRWFSSLAAFRYDPAEEYQPYENEVISYIKVVATIAPFQSNEPGTTPEFGFYPQEIIDEIEESHPCYGAVLQVGVGPTHLDETVHPNLYPYFIDFEPKKRELYQAVTDTGEVLSGSASSVSLGKSATDTSTTESYDLTTGSNVSFGWGAIGIGQGEQMGTVDRGTYGRQDVQTTDSSTERREVQSHTTQLTQMYNLFKAFHLGTNRAVFLIEPQPEIRQTEATFVNGPRAIEGIQEVLLVVVRPKGTDFCVSVLLETAHVTYTTGELPKPSMEVRHYEAKTTRDIEQKIWLDVDYKWEYNPPAMWEIDRTMGRGGYEFTGGGSYSNLHPVVTADSWILSGSLSGNKAISVDVTFYLVTTQMFPGETVRHLFLTARELCSCTRENVDWIPIQPHPTFSYPSNWIAYERDLKQHNLRASKGPISKRAFYESRRMAAVVRDELIRSVTSSRRQPRGKFYYTDSDAFHARIADVLRRSKLGGRLSQPLSELPDIDDAMRRKLHGALGHVTVGDLLTTDGAVIARALDIDSSGVGKFKTKILHAIGERPERGEEAK